MKQRAIIGGEDKIIDVEYVKIKLFDKQKALDSLTNLLGFNAPTKSELTGKDGKPLFPEMDYTKLTDEDLKLHYAILQKAKVNG